MNRLSCTQCESVIFVSFVCFCPEWRRGGFEFSTISTRSESVFKALGIHGIIAKYQEETLFLSKYNENHTDMLKFAEKMSIIY